MLSGISSTRGNIKIMILLENFLKQISSKQLVYFFVVLSVIVGWRLNYIQHGWVNNDFVLYHESARLFSLGEWKQGFDVFQWPFYSLLIASLAKLLDVNLHFSAQILSILTFALTSYSFLTIIRISNGSKLVIASGALILFSSGYLVGSVMPMLLRDPGAWAFFLLSIIFFVRFYREFFWADAIAWQLSAIIATLFRIEYITYLALMPFIITANSGLSLAQRSLLFLKAQSIGILLLLGLTALLAFSPSLSIDDFGRLREVPMFFGDKYKLMVELFTQKASIMDRQVLNGDWGGYATFGLLLAFVGMSAATCLGSLGWLNAGLLFFSRDREILISRDTRHILLFAVLLSVVNILVIVFSVFLLAGRYTAPLAFVLMIVSSFALGSLVVQSRKSSSYVFKTVVFLIVLFMMLGILKNIWPKSEGANFQQNAVAWLRANNIDNSQVFFDNARTRYYASAPFQGIIDKRSEYLEDSIRNHEIARYRYLVINHSASRLDREDLIAKELPQFRIVQRFYGFKNKKSIVIYERAE